MKQLDNKLERERERLESYLSEEQQACISRSRSPAVALAAPKRQPPS